MRKGFLLRCVLCSLLASLFLGLMISVQGQDLVPITPSGSSETVSPTPTPTTPATPAPNPRKKIVYKEKTYFEFEDTLVNGNLRAPDGSFIFRKNQATFSSALNLRRSFIPELKTSAQDAK